MATLRKGKLWELVNSRNVDLEYYWSMGNLQKKFENVDQTSKFSKLVNDDNDDPSSPQFSEIMGLELSSFTARLNGFEYKVVTKSWLRGSK